MWRPTTRSTRRVVAAALSTGVVATAGVAGGSYSYFDVNPAVVLDQAFEVPVRPGVRLRNILTVSLGDVGTIASVVNGTGGSVPNPAGNTVPRTVVAYP